MRSISFQPWLGALAAGALIAVPAVALAGDAASTRDLVLDFERSGALKDLLGKTLGVAKSFLFLSAFLAFALEAFGRSPTAERDYAAVTWRLLTVLLLLWNYQAIFGGVIGLLDRVEREVAPESTWKAFVVRATEMRQALDDLASNGEQAPPPGQAAAEPRGVPSRLATWTYEALVAVVQLLAEGIVFLINWLSRILTATLFILGPLALVAAIPRVSSTGTRWFHRFVTIASWPIFSGVLLSVLVTISGQGVQRQSYLECLVGALVMLVTALSTPLLASHVIGGALENFAAAGFHSALTVHHHATKPAWKMVAGGGGTGGGDGGDGQGRAGGGGRGAGGQGRGAGGSPGSSGVIVNGPWGGGGPQLGGGPRGGGRPPPAGGAASGGGASPPRAGTAQGGVVANPPSPPSPPPGQGPGGRSPPVVPAGPTDGTSGPK
jgi:hypothetical protein